MKAMKIACMAVALAMSTSSCLRIMELRASDDIVEREIDTGVVHSVYASSEVTVICVPDSTKERVIVRGSENVLKALNLEYDMSGRLSVSMSHGIGFRYDSREQKPVVHVFSGKVTRFTSIQGAFIEVEDTLISSSPIFAEALSGGVVRLNCVKTPSARIMAYSRGSVHVEDLISGRLESQAYSKAFISISGTTSMADIQTHNGFITTTNLIINK